jgi:hypothetical protein
MNEPVPVQIVNKGLCEILKSRKIKKILSFSIYISPFTEMG